MKVVLTQPYRAALTMREVVRSGRGIRRLVTLCGTVRQLVKENDRRLLNLSDSDEDEDDDENPEVPQPPRDPEELARRSVSFRVLLTSFNHQCILTLQARSRLGVVSSFGETCSRIQKEDK